MSKDLGVFGVFGVFGVLLCASICGGQVQPADADKAASNERLKLMGARVAALKGVDAGGEAVAFSDEALFRYSDPERGIVDATLWRLGKAGRPKAILVLELYGENSLQYEFTGAADLPKSVEGSGARWEPAAADSPWSAIPDQPPPAESRAERRRQISEVARKFTASEVWLGETIPLKLLPQALHWYDDAKANVLDGAVFALAHGTNAEILLFIEARGEKDAEPRWVAGFARVGAAQLDVSLADKPFWSQPTSGGDASRAYYLHSGTLRDEGGAP
jgi:hypothetical protein